MSSDVAVRASGVGKRYELGATTGAPALLSERLGSVARMFRGRRERAPRQELWALRDVDFELRQGEALGLVGRNGAGKSTLLKLLSRIAVPTRGRIETYGRVATLLEVGTGFHPELTGRENVYLNGAVLGMTRREIDARFEEIVEFAGVSRFLDTPVKRYSSGMYVRLAFAVAAHLEPEIMLVDEVLAVGDTEFQRKCLGKMQDVADHGRTVIFVSHNLNAVQRLCTRAFLIEAGELQLDGSPAEVIAEYTSRVDPHQAQALATIAPGAPRTGSGGARLESVAMTTLDGTPTSTLLLGQPFRLSLGYAVQRPFAEAGWELGICTPDGQRIVTAQSIDFERPAVALAEGARSVVAEIETFLLPGDYILEVQLHDIATGVTADAVPRALRFSVLNAAEHGGDHYPWQEVRGYVRPQSRWSEVHEGTSPAGLSGVSDAR
jgi:lipopolysaccharide transport system ATP-binding protein